ncbi:maltose alpha-D-glucosyltransferase [Chitinispirillales bacterium ANBcel5]|uniref:maltose alpha-D-glucosyltransferase n=1 Tax=Cellulosispirillum alkaliphilum TaxID=3039283 RepID=UPI002A54CE15|nr:maltose alpha-D-glucosyltransferase [Chitinispirillales bacterium ANBcel5]
MATTENNNQEIPLWYKDAIIYEVHVRAFGDSNSDGIGDFKGLTEKLDYLQSLGINAIWLLPFYPSPLRDDGYDISDYFNINSDYGTLRDFRDFLRAAHKRGIRVIAELVLNHTSSDHSWFQKARRASPKSKTRDVYVWSQTAEKYRDARIIFHDFEQSNWSWDHVAHAYYWHRFYAHQPDLNFDNPQVHKMLFRAIDFWFSLGVDGLRLDAVPYLYEREGTNCENLKETHDFLKKLRAHVDERYEDKMLLAEANQWPEDAVEYFGEGEECHMAFHFPLMPRMFMAIQMEDNFPIIDILRSTPDIPSNCQWALFLRNHDELTLEMVTDEERDYMYRVYAQDTRAKINLGIRRRLAPLLTNDRRKIELMNILLFSLPGTPIIYYGDEIGMGDNYYLGDRNGVRTPMQWGPDRNGGFSKANPHRLYLPVIIDPEYHYEAINVQNQESSYSSLLWWMRGLISMRKKFKAFSRGEIKIIPGDNPKILSFIREYQDETVLVVVSLSRFSQLIHLDMPEYAGYIPEEVFGRNTFPIVKETPYMLTMGPYDYYWLMLRKSPETVGVEDRVKVLHTKKKWEEIFSGSNRVELEERVLPEYLMRSRWFGAKSRRINDIKIVEDTRVSDGPWTCRFTIIKVSYSHGSDEYYLLPLSYVPKPMTGGIQEEFPQSIIADIHVDKEEGILYDGTYDERIHKLLFTIIKNRRKLRGTFGDFVGVPSRELKNLLSGKHQPIPSRPLKVEQSNTAILYDEILFLKLYRRLEEGVNPELEVLRFLGTKTSFLNIPPYAGALEYRTDKQEPLTISIMQGYVENSGNAWTYASGVVTTYFEQLLASSKSLPNLPSTYPSLFDINLSSLPEHFRELSEELFFEMVALLGKRTAELHVALSEAVDEPAFNPEPFSLLYQRSVYQALQALVQKTFRTLEKAVKKMSSPIKEEALGVMKHERQILEVMRKIAYKKIASEKIRIHGDYHLGQVLFTGKDFIIMDFEGEPTRALSERKLKRSPFRDIAGMLRSFHYVAYSTLFHESSFRAQDIEFLEQWIEPWYHYISGVYLTSYLENTKNCSFIPDNTNDVFTLLRTFLLDKAIYELGYEINNRPEWITIPIRGIKNILKESGKLH